MKKGYMGGGMMDEGKMMGRMGRGMAKADMQKESEMMSKDKMKMGGMAKKMKSGGMCCRGDGIAKRGKTKGRMC